MPIRLSHVIPFCLFIGISTVAQGFSWKQAIDSLLTVYHQKNSENGALQDIETLYLLYNICDLSLRLQREDTDEYLAQYNTLAYQLKDKEALAQARLLFTRRYLQLSDYEAMMNEAQSARAQFIQLQKPDGIVRATVRMGQAAEFLNETDSAFAYYFDALELANAQCTPPYSPDCGVVRCMANMYVANLFYERNMAEDARSYLDQARSVIEALYTQYPEDNNVAYEYATLLANMATITVPPEHYEQRINYYNQALALFRQVGYLRSEVVVLHNISTLYFSAGKVQKAKTYTMEAVEVASKGQDSLLLLQSEVMLARFLKEEGQYDTAHDILQKAEKKALHGNRTRVLSNIYAIQAQVDSLNGNYREAMAHKNRYFYYQNKLLNEERGALIKILADQVAQEKSSKEQALIEKQSAVETGNRIYRNAIILILILIIVSVSIISCLNNRSLLRQRELALQQNQVAKLEQEKLNMELEQKDMQIKHKNNELATMASRLIDRSEFFHDLRHYLDADQLSGDKAVLSDLKRQLTHQEQLAQDLEEFRLYVDEVNQDFFYHLAQKHPDLTQNEKRLCAFIRMELGVKEIATINGVSDNAIRTGKHRLRRKLNMDENSNLKEYLAKF